MPQYKLKPGEKPAIAELDGEDLGIGTMSAREETEARGGQEDADADSRGPAVARYTRSDVVGNTRLQQQQQQQQQAAAAAVHGHNESSAAASDEPGESRVQAVERMTTPLPKE